MWSNDDLTFKMADKVENPLTKRDFSKVIITLDNVMVPGDKMETTPSLQDGLSIETEMDLRILGCELIQTAGILLKLPQVAMASGQVLFQRFYYSKSFVKHDMEVVAMACINLASKIEEAPRRIRDVVNVIHHIKQVKNGKTISPLILDQKYINTKNAVIKAERRVLKELGFCVHVKHPHKIIVMFLKVLECDRNARLVQCAWNYMNDSFRTNVFMEYPPETIACTCIYLAARKLQIVLPNNPPWYELFDVEEDHLKDISVRIIKLYSRKKANPEALEKIVNEVKKIHVEAKLKAKGMTSENATPNSSSRPSSPTSKVSPTPLALSVKRIKEEDDRSDSSGYRHGSKKKRSRSRSDHSRSRSRSKSKSYSSRSRSYSPVNRRHKNHSPQKKYKKESNKDYDGRDKHHSRKRHRSPSFPHSQSRSYSRSPEVRNTKNKKYHRERYRSRSRSPSYDRYQTKSKYRSHSRSPQRPSRVQHKSKKHNGHRRSRSRDRYRR